MIFYARPTHWRNQKQHAAINTTPPVHSTRREQTYVNDTIYYLIFTLTMKNIHPCHITARYYVNDIGSSYWTHYHIFRRYQKLPLHNTLYMIPYYCCGKLGCYYDDDDNDDDDDDDDTWLAMCLLFLRFGSCMQPYCRWATAVSVKLLLRRLVKSLVPRGLESWCAPLLT